nr:MAG TPA: hypothetical protein [Caudoviricetes sp.]DAS66746.1 MAG TPA: hypothetical protein [Caudoviricetes sp.]
MVGFGLLKYSGGCLTWLVSPLTSGICDCGVSLSIGSYPPFCQDKIIISKRSCHMKDKKKFWNVVCWTLTGFIWVYFIWKWFF